MSLSARVPAAADAAGFVPEIWAKRVVSAVESNLVCAANCDLEWRKELTKGDTLNIGVLNNVTATEVVVGTEGTALDPMTGSLIPIVINQWYEAPVVLDEMTDLQSQVKLTEKIVRIAAYAIRKAIDSSVAALFSALNSGSVLGTDGNAITDDLILLCQQTLDEADVPEDNRVIIIDPSARADIFKIDKFVRNDYVRDGVIPTGKIGMIYGMPVFVTNNLAAASTGNYGVMMQKEAIGCIIQEDPKTRLVQQPLKHQQTIMVDALWGVKEIRDTFGVPFYTRSS